MTFINRAATGWLLASFLLAFVGCGGSNEFVAVLDTPAGAPPANVAAQWNRAMQLAIIEGAPRPTVISRSLYLVSASMYDAWALYDPIATPSAASPTLRRPTSEHTEENKRAAVAYAAYHSLVNQFPKYEADTGHFLKLLNEQGLGTGRQELESEDTTLPQGLGRLAAQSVLDDRAEDGSNQAGNFVDTTSATYPTLYSPVNSDDPLADNSPGMVGFDPNHWTPLRVPNGSFLDPLNPESAFVNDLDDSTYRTQTFLTPHWGAVRPFAMSQGAQFRPPAPPQAGSSAPYTDALGRTTTNDEAYNQQVDEVQQITANLTEKEKLIAEFWADGPESTTPPGHWNQFALDVAARDNLSLDDTVKLLFALNGAVFDAGIAAWDAKRHYDFIRPISAIRNKYAGQMIETWGGPGLGTLIRPGEQWIPFQIRTFVTPPFAEFVSGHSTFSAAGATVIREFAGSDVLYDGVSVGFFDFDQDGTKDLVGSYTFTPGSLLIDPNLPSEPQELHWNSLTEAAAEAGSSRLYGGIHFQDGDHRGRSMGLRIGRLALERATSLWNGGPQ